MSEARLDQIIKGLPPPNVSAPDVAIAALPESSPPERAAELLEAKKPASAISSIDPLSTVPSSPPQIYLNLLILEASLRSQYLALHARRRQHTFFLTLLGIWIAWFFYAVFLRVREDGKGLGGSVYWVVDMGEKVAFMGGFFTAVLIWATGQWERGLRWPRRWVGITNRGLRVMNLKIVILRGPWWRQPFSYLAYFFPYSSFFPSQGSSYQLMESPERTIATTSKHGYRDGNQITNMHEEDVAPGGDRVRVLLLPKAFSPEFRENWDTYRTAYWEKENDRRAGLRKSLKQQRRAEAKKNGGWLWWTGWKGFRNTRKSLHTNVADPEKSTQGHYNRQAKDIRKDRPKAISHRSGSRTSSRSSTTSQGEVDDSTDGTEKRRPQRTNSTTTTSSRNAKSPHRKMSTTGRTGSSDGMGRNSRRSSTLSSVESYSKGSDISDTPYRSASPEELKPLPSAKTRQRDIVGDSGED